MKKILLFAAALFAAVSCVDTGIEELTPLAADVAETTSTYELTELTGGDEKLTVAIGDSSDTRVDVDTSGSTWETTWSSSDILISYYSSDGSNFSYYSSFYMYEHGDEVSTFSGSSSYDSWYRRLVLYPDYTKNYEFIDGALCMVSDISIQEEGVKNTYMVDSEFAYIEDNAYASPVMKHVGSAAELITKFNNVPEGSTLMSIVVKDVVTGVKCNLLYDVDSESFVVETTTGDILVNLDPTAIESYTDESSLVSIKFNMMPFDVAAGDSISVVYYFTDGDNNALYSEAKITNNSDSAVSFERGKYHKLYTTCDMSVTTSDSIELTLADISSSNVPSQGSWIITDTTAALADFSGFCDAIEALEDTGRRITVRFPNLTEIPSYIFGTSAYDWYYSTAALYSFTADVATTVNSYAFRNCYGLAYVDLPEATTIPYYGFYQCNALKSVNMPKAETIYGYAFYDCPLLESVEASSVKTINVGAFYICESLKSFDMPVVETISTNVFCYSGIESITLPSTLTEMGGGVFNGCESLTSIVSESSNYKVENGIVLTADGTMTISAAEPLLVGDIVLPESVTTVGPYSFRDCYQMTSFTAPSAHTINRYGLAYCSVLTDVDMPVMTCVDDYAITRSNKLTNLSIATEKGNVVTSFSSSTFAYGSITSADINLIIGEDNSELVSDVYLIVAGVSNEFKTITVVDGDGNTVSTASEKWELVTAANGSTTGTYTDGNIAELFNNSYSASKEVEVYESSAKPGYYRIKNIYTSDFTTQFFNGTLSGSSSVSESDEIYTYIDATNSSEVWIPTHNTGYYMGDDYGYYIFGSFTSDEYSFYGGSSANYGTMVNGYISFPATSMYLELSLYSSGPWNIGGAGLSLLLPGGSLPSDEADWEIVTAEDGSTTGSWTDDLLSGVFSSPVLYPGTKDVEIYENIYTPGYYRIKNLYTAELTSQMYGCSIEDEEGYAVDPETTTIYTYIDATDPDAVWIEFHDVGYYTGETYGNIWFGSYVPDYFSSGSSDHYGKLVDGVITFPASSIFLMLDGYSTSTGWLTGTNVSLTLPEAYTSSSSAPAAAPAVKVDRSALTVAAQNVKAEKNSDLILKSNLKSISK